MELFWGKHRKLGASAAKIRPQIHWHIDFGADICVLKLLRIMLRLLLAININVSLLCAVQANLYVSVQFDDGVFAKIEEESLYFVLPHGP